MTFFRYSGSNVHCSLPSVRSDKSTDIQEETRMKGVEGLTDGTPEVRGIVDMSRTNWSSVLTYFSLDI